MEKDQFTPEITREDDVIEVQNNQPKDKTALKAMLLGGLGALVGASAEAAIVNAIQSDEPTPTPEPVKEEEPVTPEPQQNAPQHTVVTHVHKHEYEVEVKTDHEGVTPPPTPSDPEVIVTNYTTIYDDEDGTPLYDMAVIEVKYPDGTSISGAVIDQDRDGVADVMLLDANTDGQISQDEMVRLQEENIFINMGNLREVAQNVETDYRNDVVTADPANDVAIVDNDDDVLLADVDKGDTDNYEEEDDTLTAIEDEPEDYIAENDPCLTDDGLANNSLIDDVDTGILDA